MDLPNFKLLRLPFKAWMTFLLLLESVEICFMLWIILDFDWVQTKMGITSNLNFEILKFNGQVFEGSLSRCKSGCQGSYNSNMQDWCQYEISSESLISESVCKLFASLYYGSVLYIFFNFISIILKIVKCFTIIHYLRSNKYENLGNISSKLSIIMISFGIFLWSTINNVWFGSECSDFPQFGNKIDVCVKEGYTLSFVLVGLSVLFEILYCYVMGKFYKGRELLIRERGNMNPNMRFFKYLERLSISTSVGFNSNRRSGSDASRDRVIVQPSTETNVQGLEELRNGSETIQNE